MPHCDLICQALDPKMKSDFQSVNSTLVQDAQGNWDMRSGEHRYKRIGDYFVKKFLAAGGFGSVSEVENKGITYFIQCQMVDRE